MDRCPSCDKRMMPALSPNGRTEFQCLRCEPAHTSTSETTNWDRYQVQKAA
jgi:tRNA(Ile2) C34 agmatinyltransferase TiaS